MKSFSCSSTDTDAYRAGRALGEQLAAIQPEVILLFSSIHYEGDFPGLFDGLRDALGNRKPLIFGGTGDGVYEAAGCLNQGISALGLNSGGTIQWTVALQSGVEADAFSAAQRCGHRALEALGGAPAFTFVMATGKDADGNRLLAGLKSVLRTPCLGGLSGDDRKFQRAYLFADGAAHADAVGVLLGRGPIRYFISTGSGWKPAGEPGYVEAANGNQIERIAGQTALAFMRDQIGKNPSDQDLGLVPLASPAEGSGGHMTLRAASYFDNATGAVTVMGGVPLGTRVQICSASRADVVHGVDDALAGMAELDFAPSAALVMSCAGRKWLMGDQGQEEWDLLKKALGPGLPWIGLLSFGEIAPFRLPGNNYTESCFHNVTFVICLLGP